MKGPYYLPLTVDWMNFLPVEYLRLYKQYKMKFLDFFYLLSY